MRNEYKYTLFHMQKKTGETSNCFSRLLDLMCIRVSHYVSTVKRQSLKELIRRRFHSRLRNHIRIHSPCVE